MKTPFGSLYFPPADAEIRYEKRYDALHMGHVVTYAVMDS